MEYKFEKVLFSDQSPYQFVQIVDTLDFGPFLILDGYANYAESDKETYTHMLMNLPHEDYSVKAKQDYWPLEFTRKKQFVDF